MELVSVQNCPENKTKHNKTNPEQIHMFTYSTYLHIGNNPDNYLFKIFSLVFYLYFYYFFGKGCIFTLFQITLQKLTPAFQLKMPDLEKQHET